MKYTLPLGILLALTSCVRSPADPQAAPTRPAAPLAPAPISVAPQQPAGAPPQANVSVGAPQSRPVSPQTVAPQTVPATAPVAGAVPRAAPAAGAAPSATAPAAPLVSPDAALAAAQLDIEPDERQYFQFGYYLARSAFAYAELSKRSLAISQVRSKTTQIHQLADLQPPSFRKREEVRLALEKTLSTMRDLRAPASAIAVIENQSREYSRPLVLTGDAKLLADYNAEAGQALGALSEFERTSGIPENTALHQWLTAPTTSTTAKVWYAEGLIAGIAQIASKQQMPELLPPISDVAVDLRGLRDWLSSRLPDQPAVGLTQLRGSLDSFLQLTANNRPTKRSLTPSELLMLGNVSELLTTQILGPEAIGDLVAAPTTVAANSIGGTGVVGAAASVPAGTATPASTIAPAPVTITNTVPTATAPSAATSQQKTVPAAPVAPQRPAQPTPPSAVPDAAQPAATAPPPHAVATE